MVRVIGDKVVVGGCVGEVVRVDTSVSPTLYTLVFLQPVARNMTDEQLDAQITKSQPQTRPGA